MPTSRPFARNTGAPIAGTEQVGNLAIGTPTAGFAATGLPWWNGPDEELGYVIATQVAANNQPTPVPATTASVGFWRSSALTDASFISLAEYVSRISGTTQTFATASDAKTWLNANGYWTSWVVATLQVGDFYGGGIVAYILQPGDPGYDANVQHGLIASIGKSVGSASYGCYPPPTTIGGTVDAFGYGSANTTALLNNCATRPMAASVARGHNGGGFTDWYLPVYDELIKLYDVRAIIGGFDSISDVYYTSAEVPQFWAWTMALYAGAVKTQSEKNASRLIRAVRNF